jgi:uncharacterized protein (TIGR00251 family)
MTFVRQRGDGAALLSLYVQPKASRNAVVGLYDGALKVTVAAPPVDGQANAAVMAFLAATLDVAKKDIILAHGQNGRRKQFIVRGLSAEAIREKLAPG